VLKADCGPTDTRNNTSIGRRVTLRLFFQCKLNPNPKPNPNPNHNLCSNPNLNPNELTWRRVDYHPNKVKYRYMNFRLIRQMASPLLCKKHAYNAAFVKLLWRLVLFADECRYNVELDYNANKLDCNCPQLCTSVFNVIRMLTLM